MLGTYLIDMGPFIKGIYYWKYEQAITLIAWNFLSRYRQTYGRGEERAMHSSPLGLNFKKIAYEILTGDIGSNLNFCAKFA